MGIFRALRRIGLSRQSRNELTVLVERADRANRKREWSIAERYYGEALKRVPGNHSLWVQYGHSLKEQGNFVAAEAAYTTALSLKGDSADTYLQLGHVLKLQRRMPEAIDAYRESLRIDPSFEHAKIELSRPEIHIAVAADRSADQVMAAISAHFDAEYYQHEYPDVRQAAGTPLQHYCTIGWLEHRNPAEWFDTAFYLRAYADVRTSGINPFFHYIAFGKAEGRAPREKLDDRLGLLASLRDELRPLEPATVGVPTDTHHLEDAIADSLVAHPAGLVLSVSHTCYVEVVAGTELVVGNEQLSCNAKGLGYLHLSPVVPSAFIFDSDPSSTYLKVVLDGSPVGVFASDALMNVLRAHESTTRDRILAIHSALGHSLPVLIELARVFLPSKSFFWLHDYYSLCNGYNLLRNHLEYCGAPPVGSVACRICVFGGERVRRLEQMNDLFAAIPFIVLSPSQVALDVWRKAFTGRFIGAEVVPHSTLVPIDSAKRERAEGAPLKVAFVGYPVEHKGWRVFSNIVAGSRFDGRYEFLHFVSDSFEYRESRYVQRVHAEIRANSTGTMVELLRKHAVDIVVIPSGWPETFSFVAYESIAAGCIVLTVRDSGNVAAVTRRMAKGRVFDSADELVKFFSEGRAPDMAEVRAPTKETYELEFTGGILSSQSFRAMSDV